MSSPREILAATLCILKRGNSFGRLRILAKYYGLELWALAKGRSDGEKRIFRHRMRFGDAKVFVFLFKEIFIDEPYRITLPPSPRILDCGANTGMSLAYFYSRHPDARITAFGPDKMNFGFLAQNCKLNGWTADLRQVALDRGPGERTWYTFEPAGTLQSGFRTEFSSAAPKATYPVRTAGLSEYIDGHVDLLKLDVEGAENAIIQGLVESGKIASIDHLVMEYHHHIAPEGDRLGQLLCNLESAGFGYDF
jgi:FkbM family methyltransferase